MSNNRVNAKVAAAESPESDGLARFIQSPWLAAVAIAAVTFLVFIRALSADFVMYDDPRFIYENPSLGGCTLENLRLILTNVTISSSWYTPLTGLLWCFIYQFCQFNPLGYHLANLLFHMVNAVLVFFILRKLLSIGLYRSGHTEPRRINVGASLGALLWSLHPMRVEAVNWAVVANCQASFFVFISLLCYLGAVEAKRLRKRRWLLTASVMLFAAALLTQPLVIGFLGILFVIDVYPLGRIGGNNGWWRSATKDARRALLEKIPFIGVAVAIVLINIIVQAYSPIGGHRLVSLAEFGLLDRFMQAMYVWAYFVWRPWYPFHFLPLYTTLVIFEPLSLKFIACALAVVVGIIVLILLRHRWPLGLVLGISHLVLLVPVLGLTDHPHYANDRYSILSSLTWSVLLAVWLASPATKKMTRRVAIVMSSIVITVLTFLTYQQTRVWDNSVTLFEHMIHQLDGSPFCYEPHYRLGLFLSTQDQADKAMKHFEEAIRIKPACTEASIRLATILSRQGKYDEAIDCLDKARMHKPNVAEIYRFLGWLYSFKGEKRKTVAYWKESLKLRPDDGDVLNYMVHLLVTSRDPQIYNPQEAIRLAQKACEHTHHQNPSLLHDLAIAYAFGQRFQEAITASEKALELAEKLDKKKLIEKIRYVLEQSQAGIHGKGDFIRH